MKPQYPDLLEGRPEPLWYDERGVPRWVEWEPGIGEEGYVDEAVLLLIECQNCGREFRVSMHHDWYEGHTARERGEDDSFARRIRERTLHYGDPPASGCCFVGETMNSVPLRVLEYWHRPIVGSEGFRWRRDPSLEVEIVPDWWGEGGGGNMNDLQALLDGLRAQSQRERAKTQMTLGKLIEALEAMPEGALVANLRNPHSFRGYYDDLALEPFEGLRPARELLQECRAVMGRALMGYKGGEYVMGEVTPVWVSGYGVASGMRLMALHPDGKVDVAEEEW